MIRKKSDKELTPLLGGTIKLGELASNFEPTGLASAAVWSLDWLRDYVLKRRESRLIEFHRELLKQGPGKADFSDANIPEADFHALLTACVTDIEDEKTTAFALMARNIALGSVNEDVRRHFILSLRDLSFDQLDMIRRFYVISAYKIGFPGSNQTLTVKGELAAMRAGSLTHLDLLALQSKAFLDDEKLTDIGRKFVTACTPPDMLEPSVYEYRQFTPYTCQIISTITDERVGDPFMLAIAAKLSKEMIRTPAIIGLGGVDNRINQVPLYANCGIILRSKSEDIPEAASQALEVLCRKIPFIQAVAGGQSSTYLGWASVPFDSETPDEHQLDALVRVLREKASNHRKP